jgi:hypothetical protein
MVLYTLIGTLIGGTVTFVFCKVCNVSFEEDRSRLITFPSTGKIMVVAGTVIGGSIGLGYELASS